MSTKVETALLEMASKLGNITGKLDTHIENQDKVNDRLARLLEKQDERDDTIEEKANLANGKVDAVTNKAIGFGAGAGIASGGIIAGVMKIFG